MTQEVNSFFVVGDTFAGTAIHLEALLTETEALEKVMTTVSLPTDVKLYLQQGVDLRSLAAAVDHFNNSQPHDAARFQVEKGNNAARATRRLAHKNKTENICISAPRQTDSNVFEMDLFFTGQNEFFLDHMTGMHIQGMALVEAARQAFLAVTEAFYIKDEKSEFYFVIKSMDTSFQNFVFPFDAALRYEVTRASQKDNRHGFDAIITISQAGKLCTTVSVSFTAFEASAIAEKERVVAQECFSTLLANYSSKAPALHAISEVA